MHRSVIAGAAMTLGLFAVPKANSAEPLLHLKEERMTIEYWPDRDEASVVLEAESEESLDRVEIRNPSGTSILKLRSGGSMTVDAPNSMVLQGLVLETKEMRPGALFKIYPEGIYDIFARTENSGVVVGNAQLSHELPSAPLLIYPRDGLADVAANDLEVSWLSDPQAAGHTLVLEQGESDGLKVELSAGTSSFKVPDGVLAPNRRTRLEIGAIGPSGNTTLVEIAFRTL